MRSAIRECVDDYLELFGEHIVGGMSVDGAYCGKSAKGIDNIRAAITSTPGTQRLRMELSSVPDAETAREYHLAVETAENVYEAKFGLVSCLKFSIPARLFLRIQNHRIYQGLLLRICSRLDICGGYGGLSVMLPYHYRRYQSQEYRLARTYTGLEADVDPFSIRRLCAPLHFKSVNWYTILGDNAIAELGGVDALHARADDRIIDLMRAGNGLLVRAGKYPSWARRRKDYPQPTSRRTDCLGARAFRVSSTSFQFGSGPWF
ncbi:type VI immunity family protein [Ralstonia syzygii]|uniref:type VI immunity family protein n=1 Tax=Ralstonia syzygii TaxID=28097 RepID=UPI002E1E0260